MQWVKASERLPKEAGIFRIIGKPHSSIYLRMDFTPNPHLLFNTSEIEWLDESENAVYAIEVPQNKLYQLYTKEQIINAHMAGQRNAGVDPSYSAALAHYEQEKKDV